MFLFFLLNYLSFKCIRKTNTNTKTTIIATKTAIPIPVLEYPASVLHELNCKGVRSIKNSLNKMFKTACFCMVGQIYLGIEFV